jgi:hypothetical protein
MKKNSQSIYVQKPMAGAIRVTFYVTSTTHTLSGSHAYQHSFQVLLSYKLPTCSNIPGFTQTSQQAPLFVAQHLWVIVWLWVHQSF